MPRSDLSFLNGKHIVIACHYSATAFIQHLEEYLTESKLANVLYISHPLYPQKDPVGSFFRLTEKGRIVRSSSIKFPNIPAVIHYVKDALLDVVWVLTSFRVWDLYIGADNLNTFAGIILKRLGLVKRVVFYTVDFVPNRFSNKTLNNFYHWVEKFAVLYSDEVWILSPRVIEGRREILGLDKRYDKKQKLVPEGVWIERIERKPFEKINKQSAVFVGHLVERMGVQLVIESIPDIIKTNPKFMFIVIGKGEYRAQLEKLVKKLGVSKHVEFKGYVPDHKDVETIIALCGVGIATYTKEDASGLTYFADPAKTKLYLGAGLPVVMTDTFYNAYDIEKAGGGIVAGDNPVAVGKAIVSIIKNEKRLRKYRDDASSFAREFDHPKLFSDNLRRALSL